jgi:Zn-dependent protease with chaperone function
MTMDFFEQQDVARRKTGWLVLLYALAVVGIILTIYLVIALLIGANTHRAHFREPGYATMRSLWNPELFLWVGLGTVAVISLGSLVKIAELSSGGEAVALMLGGRLVQRPTEDPAEQRLLNVVEEMALASGLPVPPVYVLEHESSINAFAAGLRADNAVVAVSRGCLRYLTRDELQGVLGHEFSHILNGDMRLNLRLVGVLNGILLLAILGYYMLRFGGSVSSDSDKKGGGVPLALIGLCLLVIGYIGVLFGKIIKSSVSRQREFLADASSVQFTRNPSGIAGALRKIGGLSEGSRIKDRHAEEISHMFFGDAFAGSFFNVFATHPPLGERIKRVDAAFDGTFPRVVPLDESREAVATAGHEQKRREMFGSMLGARGGTRPHAATMPMNPAAVLGGIGAPGMAQMLFAGALLDDMPRPILDAAREAYGARSLVYAILLDREQEVREKQLRIIQSRSDETSYKLTTQLASQVDQLGDESRLPLVNVALGALKKLSPEQYAEFRDNVQALIEADSRVNLFEYSVRTMILENLDVYFRLSKPAQVRYASVTPLQEPLSIVLSTLAYSGQQVEGDAQRSLAAAVKEISGNISLLPPGQCTLSAFDKAIHVLAESSPQLKKRITGAAAACIAADGTVTVKEAELMRAVAAVLGCPIPPILPEQAA